MLLPQNRRYTDPFFVIGFPPKTSRICFSRTLLDPHFPCPICPPLHTGTSIPPYARHHKPGIVRPAVQAHPARRDDGRTLCPVIASPIPAFPSQGKVAPQSRMRFSAQRNLHAVQHTTLASLAIAFCPILCYITGGSLSHFSALAGGVDGTYTHLGSSSYFVLLRFFLRIPGIQMIHRSVLKWYIVELVLDRIQCVRYTYRSRGW